MTFGVLGPSCLLVCRHVHPRLPTTVFPFPNVNYRRVDRHHAVEPRFITDFHGQRPPLYLRVPLFSYRLTPLHHDTSRRDARYSNRRTAHHWAYRNGSDGENVCQLSLSCWMEKVSYLLPLLLS
jgi:hypothetical protein